MSSESTQPHQTRRNMPRNSPHSAVPRDLACVTRADLARGRARLAVRCERARLSVDARRRALSTRRVAAHAVRAVAGACVVRVAPLIAETRSELRIGACSKKRPNVCSPTTGVLRTRRMQAEELERRHLARELHDELGQYLNAISLDAARIRDLSAAREPEIHRISVGIDAERESCVSADRRNDPALAAYRSRRIRLAERARALHRRMARTLCPTRRSR